MKPHDVTTGIRKSVRHPVISATGEGLIFLISQPRSGSTLLQHILAGHPDVKTLPETWLMLHPMYARRKRTSFSEYNSEFARLALEGFLGRIKNGDTVFDGAVGSYAMQLYNAALDDGSAKYFLDKTPRYYLIIKDIIRIFPDAKIIFLLRNPLAVFSSIMSYNFQNNWACLLDALDRKADLLLAPVEIANSINQIQNPIVVYYEKLVSMPDATIRDLCEKLDIGYRAQMLDYSGVDLGDTTFMDLKSVSMHKTAVTDYISSWSETLTGSGAIRFAVAYIASLDPNVLRVYGVEKDSLLADLGTLSGQVSPSSQWVRRIGMWGRFGRFERLCNYLVSISEREGGLSAAKWFVGRLLNRVK